MDLLRFAFCAIALSCALTAQSAERLCTHRNDDGGPKVAAAAYKACLSAAEDGNETAQLRATQMALPSGVYRIGGDVRPPQPIFHPPPKYTDEASKAHLHGTVFLSVVVTAKGTTRDVTVIRRLGLGLDQKAGEAVSKWRFRPATKNGKAVPVQANILVNFRLPQHPGAGLADRAFTPP